MVIDKPDKEFWSMPNLFYAFRDCLLKLNDAVLSTNLCDTFDSRLKLLIVLPKSLKRCHEESKAGERAKLGETCRKFVPEELYKTISYTLQDVAIGLQISMQYGPKSVISFLESRVFRLRQFHKLWTKVEISLLDVLTKEPEDFHENYYEENKLERPLGGTSGSERDIKNIFQSILVVATPEIRKKWNQESKWIKYTDEKEERSIFLKNIASKDFKSNVIIFRSFLFQEEVEPTKCTWCGEVYDNSKHIFWECSKVKEFWQEYCLKPGKWNKEYNMDDIDEFVNDLLNPQNLDLCSWKDNQWRFINTKLHKIRLLKLAKEYLIICQKIGVQPLQNELQCQLEATQNGKSKEGISDIMFEHWFECPLPPPKGTILK